MTISTAELLRGTGAVTGRVVRHRLVDRLYHWTMAVSVLVLLGTAFLPILGFKFAWVTPHWIAGVVLTVLVLAHILRAVLFQDLRSMLVTGADLANAVRLGRQMLGLGGPPPGKPGKYLLLQKLYHLAAALVVLALIVTGALMLLKIDTPLWRRSPYWFADHTWGLIYVVHGLCAMATITLVMIHIYFALRPEKLWITRSMLRGWITAEEHRTHHDPARWPGER